MNPSKYNQFYGSCVNRMTRNFWTYTCRSIIVILFSKTYILRNLSCNKCIRYRFCPNSHSTIKHHTWLHINQPSSHRSYYSNTFQTVPHRQNFFLSSYILAHQYDQSSVDFAYRGFAARVT